MLSKNQMVFWTLTAGTMLAWFPCLSDSFMSGENRLFVLILLTATAVSAYRSFYLCVKDEYAALSGSMIYLLNPYHIHIIYIRGDVGETLVMVFLPLIGCGIYLLCVGAVTGVGHKNSKWYVVVGMSAVLCSRVLFVRMAGSDAPELVGGISSDSIGAGAIMLLCVYVLWSVWRKKWDRVCAILAGCSVLFLQLPRRWMAWATVFVSMFAAFFCLQIKEYGGILLKTAAVIAAAIVVGTAIYHVNGIAYALPECRLYIVEDVGAISQIMKVR